MKKNHQKSLHRGEGSAPRAFTSYHIIINHLRTKGEEVKAKNEKERTRARVRGRRKLRCGDEKQDSSTRFEKKRVSKRKHGSFSQKLPCFNVFLCENSIPRCAANQLLCTQRRFYCQKKGAKRRFRNFTMK